MIIKYLLGFIMVLSILFLIFMVLYFLFRNLKVRKVSDGTDIKYVVERSFLGLLVDYKEHSHLDYYYTPNLDEAEKHDTIEGAMYLISYMEGNTRYKKIK